MSLARTALRLGAVMALAGGFEAPFPTIARGRVFDTLLDPRQIADGDDAQPMLTVCTDDDSGEIPSINNGGPPFVHQVKIVIEASVGKFVEIDGATAFDPMPETDAELEALLDLLEHQVKAALVHPVWAWSTRFDRLHTGLTDWTSHTFREPEANIRLAGRRMITTARLQIEEPVAIAADPPLPGAIPGPLGPLLTEIVASTSPYGPAAEALQTLLTAGGAAAAAVTLPRLERVRLIERRQAETNAGGTPRGPRAAGVANIDF